MLSGGVDRLCFGWISSDRFLAKDMFSGGSGCLNYFEVHTVWSGDIDYLYVLVCYDISEIGSCAFKSET